ncbi:MAG: hypothetical protein QOH82_4593 [Mycobacterium sp.]|nr:hypothetical protein [Mycobacterium sp.]
MTDLAIREPIAAEARTPAVAKETKRDDPEPYIGALAG